MAGKTAILSVRIISDSDRGVAGLTRTAAAVGVLDKAASKGGASLRGMAAATPRILALATAIITLGSAALVSIGHISAFITALAPLGGLVLGLPGMLAGAIAGIAVLAMAFRDAGKHLGDLGPKFAAIQAHVSGSFWEQAAAPIRSLALSILPALDRALTKSGSILGTAFASSAGAAKAALGTVLAPALANINTGFRNASGAAAPFTRALINLTAAGTEVLPRLGTALAGVGKRFDAWITAASDDGRLVGWINGGITALGQLGSLLGSLGGILGGLFKGLSTGGTLGTMAASLREVSAAMNSVKGQAVLGQIMGAAGNVIAGITPGVRALAGSLTALGPTITAVSQQIGPVLNPVLTALGGIIRQMAPHVTTLVNALGPALAAAFGALGKTLPGIAAQLGPIVATLGTGLAQVITALAPKLAAIGTAFGKLLAAIRPLLAIVMPVLVPALKFLGGILLTAVKGAIDGVTQVIKGFTQILSGLITFFKGVFTGNWKMAWSGLKTIAAGIFNAIVGAVKTWLNVTIMGIFRGGLLKLTGLWKGGWSGLKSAASAGWNAIKAFFTRGINGIKSVFSNGVRFLLNIFAKQMRAISSTAGAVMSTIGRVIGAGIARVRGFFSAGFAAIRGVVTKAFGAIRTAAQGGVTGLIRLAASLPGKVISAIGNMHSKMTTIGKQIIAGMIAGVGNMAGKLVSKVGDAITGAKNKAKSLLGISSPSKVFKSMGHDTARGYIIGIDKMTRRTQSAMADLVAPPKRAATITPPTVQADTRRRGATGGQTVNITINGALDPLAVAEQIKRVLRKHDVVVGAA